MASFNREDAHWFVLRTKPKQESRAGANLEAWGVQVLAPRIQEVRCDHYSQRVRSSVAPLFPSYIFAQFRVDELYTKVRLTRGIQGVVGLGECATPVDDSVIEWIRARLDHEGVVRVDEPQPGDSVTVLDGPFRALSAIFQCRRGPDRALVLLAFLGAQVRVELAMTAVRSAAGGLR